MRKLCKVFAVMTLATALLAACGKAPAEEKPTGTPEVTATTAPSEEGLPTAAPTETPEPTATPAPTATPKPTPKPTPIVVVEQKPVYDFNDLVYQGSYGTVYEVQSDGSIELQFEGQYQEIKLTIPEEIDMAHCHEVTVKAKSAFAPLSFKLYDASGNQIFVEYSCKSDDTATDFVLTPDITEKATGIGLMALDQVDDFSQYKVTVYSVTFAMDEGYAVERIEVAEAPLVPETENGATLLNTYGKTFGYIGTCINPAQLRDKKTLEKVKAQYNSVTLENDMKPDHILGGTAKLISLDEAKELGYVIPENYTESTIPKLNLASTDTVMKICAENGLGLRGHTLVWHSQTPTWFFREGYQADGAWVTPEVMDARLEFYIRSVMGHVYDNENGHVVYSWDVVNEYVHATDSGWEAVYGNEGLAPGFVKKSYELADDVLKQYGIRDQVTLIFNDFNTYIDYAKIIEVMKFINSEEKLCDGVGMQAHLSTSSPTEIKFATTVKEFLSEGFEVQITELDIGNNGEGTQAMYAYDLMKRLLKIKSEGGAITGITWWGVADNVSWRPGENALMFTNIDTPKKTYFQVLKAYTDAGFTVGE